MNRGLSRRRLLQAVPAGALGLGAAPTVSKRRGNVLLITTDQQSSRSLAALGQATGATPHLDALAQRGTLFANSWCVDPSCSPARAAWVMGRPGSETGVVLNRLESRNDLPEMGGWLRDQGVNTLLLGKWHVPGLDPRAGFSVGCPAPLNADLGDPMQLRAALGALATLPADQPFFLWVSLLGPHDVCHATILLHQLQAHGAILGDVPPEALPPAPVNLTDRAGEPALIGQARRGPAVGSWTAEGFRHLRWWNDRMVGMVDAIIGRLLQGLAESVHAANTSVIVTSDHGENLGEHGLTFKESPYEAALSVPFFFSAPGRVAATGVDRQRLVSGLDVFPTVCDLFGLAPPPGLPGRSVLAQLEGRDPGHPYIVSETLVEGRMVRDARYKLVRFRADPQGMLFDLQADPYERHNRFGDAALAGVEADLERALVDWTGRQQPHARAGLPFVVARDEARKRGADE
jgi:choline-sulfatase